MRKVTRTIRAGMLVGFWMALAGESAALQVEMGEARSNSFAAQHAQASSALPLVITLQVEPKETRVGDPIQVQVDVRGRMGVLAQPWGWGEIWGDWEVQKIVRGTATPEGEAWVQHDVLTLAAYEPGSLNIPSLAVKFHQPDGQTGEYRSAPLPVVVKALPPRPGDQPGQIRGLKAPWGMVSWWWVGGILLLVILAGGAVGWWVRRQAGEAGGDANVPVRRPEEVARERLAALAASPWVAEGAWKTYYIQLSDILRHYLEGQFNIPAIDRTTRELIRSIKANPDLRSEQVVIRDVLEISDLVKFAKGQAQAQSARSHWQMVADLVERTTAVIRAAQASAADSSAAGRAS